MLHVEFLKPCGPYNVGEVAGFSKETAEQYVDAKIAKLVEVKTAAKPEKAQVE